MIENKYIYFTTQSYSYMKGEFSKHENFEKGEIDFKIFPDGEKYQKVISSIKGKNVVIIGGTINESDTLELYDLCCGLAKFGAKSLIIIIPYFGYATMERAIKFQEIVTAKTRARLLSSIPSAKEGNHIVLIDLHSEGIPHYFEGSVTTSHLYAKPIIFKAIKDVYPENDFVLGCTDSGRAKWVESLANDLGVNPAFILKRRISGSKTEIMAVNAQVENKNVIIYDDMIRTGSSLINAATAYKNAGAKEIVAITTHGLFPDNSLKKIENTNLFKKIISLNTHPNVLKEENKNLIIYSVCDLIVSHIENDL